MFERELKKEVNQIVRTYNIFPSHKKGLNSISSTYLFHLFWHKNFETWFSEIF